jgi:hypothetical protein
VKVILSQEEIKQAVVDYLAVRGVDVEQKSIQLSVTKENYNDNISAHVFNVQLTPKEGPYR